MARREVRCRRLDAAAPAGKAGPSSVYQSANRYAHLYWLRERIKVEAWLVHVLIVDDETFRTTTRADWEKWWKQEQESSVMHVYRESSRRWTATVSTRRSMRSRRSAPAAGGC
jgi:hypothetical protein